MNSLTKWILGSMFALLVTFGSVIWAMNTDAIDDLDERKADKMEVRHLREGQREIKGMIREIQDCMKKIEINQARDGRRGNGN